MKIEMREIKFSWGVTLSKISQTDYKIYIGHFVPLPDLLSSQWYLLSHNKPTFWKTGLVEKHFLYPNANQT